MIEMQFDVENEKLRNEFLTDILPRAVDALDKSASPSWGKMSAQHMIEHLTSTFEISTGKIKAECRTPDKLLPRVKSFLKNNTETPHNFKNPLLGDDPPPFRFSNFSEAKTKLLEEIKVYLEYFRTNPDAVYVHPIFGPIGKEEWERAMFKHCYHHLLQFGTISTPKQTAN